MSKERHVFTFNPDSNGGEQLHLTTFVEAGWLNQELSLNSYGNTASFNLGFFMNPGQLRQLANELDKFLIENKGAIGEELKDD